MDEKEVFFEIREMEVSGELKANFVIVENNGTGAAYLGWCENLAIDTPETMPANSAVEPTPLFLPFADLALLTNQGSPVPAPKGWRETVMRPLTIQDYLLVTLDENFAVEPGAVPIPG